MIPVPAQDEAELARELARSVPLDGPARARILAAARALVAEARTRRHNVFDLDGILGEYRLSTPEGLVLMSLAEALLRIPDKATRDLLIKDKLTQAHWDEHLGHSPQALVNASTRALMLGASVLGGRSALGLTARLGETVMRGALEAAMGMLGRRFVMGQDMPHGLSNGQSWQAKGYRLSFDMLGEAARTPDAAMEYFESYEAAIGAVGKAAAGLGPIQGPGVSVKLSALHPRFEPAQRERVMAELAPRLLELARAAKAVDIGLTVDAEEADRLELSLDVMGWVLADPSLAGWDGFGLAVQAYQPRAPQVVDWVLEQAQARPRRMMVRLVKGAYWDTEIKRAQERGLDRFPVFTTKPATDISYLALAARLLAARPSVFPQFATHNAHTMAAVRDMAGEPGDWEYQRLHGMGETLYAQLVPHHPCRIYAPVGSHDSLLPYLVRRLLENGANSSFVNHMADNAESPDQVVTDPLDGLDVQPRVKAPNALFLPERVNSTGLDLASQSVQDELVRGLKAAGANPIPEAQPTTPDRAMAKAAAAFDGWNRLGGAARAAILESAADFFEAHRQDLMAIAITEAGKTIPDALAEVREAVDFLRHYAAQARRLFGAPTPLPAPVGEANRLVLSGRGVFACLSPWNFPLAIFTGQIAAALAAGNGVVAKPAPQTPRMALAATALLHRAGVPVDVLQLVIGGAEVGQALVQSPLLAGVAFTGSLATAKSIAQALAARPGAILPLIAETGGVNVMVADSSALPEQLCADVLESAFRSAGQRCSALRALLIQDEAWAALEPILGGAIECLHLGDPGDLATDIGPIIDEPALDRLRGHAAHLDTVARLVAKGGGVETGRLFAPRAYHIKDMAPLAHEVFGPIVHVLTWSSGQLDQVLAQVAGLGHGLTLGIHSRIDSRIRAIIESAKVGNIYVNRPMIGAVVGAQPFGGQGLSGTGPKAGGPYTLLRYATEVAVSVNTAAMGGDPAVFG
jgi:RHH-type proline utilization regulon transcriptional repressor/proline dehydrogenase/delta 1-pyrroline-5-carboxylate dehydrogenase